MLLISWVFIVILHEDLMEFMINDKSARETLNYCGNILPFTKSQWRKHANKTVIIRWILKYGTQSILISLSTNIEFYIYQTRNSYLKDRNRNDGIIFCLFRIMVIWLHWLKVKRFSVSAVECFIFVGSISLLKISLVSLYKKVKIQKWHILFTYLRWRIE